MNTIMQLPEWQQLVSQYKLTEQQQQKLAHYLELLRKWNTNINLTAIRDIPTMIMDHLYDSCSIKEHIAQTKPQGIADVGTGGGLPGIPIAIMFPEIPIYLIEVVDKKIAFLQIVIQELQLTNVFISGLDWRTFLRTTYYDIDLFCARASLSPVELIRMFKDSSPYKKAGLAYWASVQWNMENKEKPFFVNEYKYTVGNKTRRLIFFKK